MRFNPRALLLFALFAATVWLAVSGRFGLVAAGAAAAIELALWIGLVAGPSGTSEGISRTPGGAK